MIVTGNGDRPVISGDAELYSFPIVAAELHEQHFSFRYADDGQRLFRAVQQRDIHGADAELSISRSSAHHELDGYPIQVLEEA